MNSDLKEFSFLLDDSDEYYNKSKWGPKVLDSNVNDIPYIPFSPLDKIGKLADWEMGDVKYGKPQKDPKFFAPSFHIGYSPFTYLHEDEETTFSSVEGKGTGKKSTSGTNKVSSSAGKSQVKFLHRPGQAQTGKMPYVNRRKNWKDLNKSQRFKDASISVGHDWKIIEEIEFSRLSKLQCDLNEPEELSGFGTVYYTDKSFDKISTKNEKTLIPFRTNYVCPTTSDDPILCQYAKDGIGNIFATDSILSVLMAAPRSVFPWDIIIRQEGGNLFFDKRDASSIGYITVGETAAEPPIDHDKDALNSASSLAHEATDVNFSFSQQLLKRTEKIDFEHPNLFDPDSTMGYRYRKWELGNNMALVIRTEVDAVTKHQDNLVYLTLRALNESDPKLSSTEWKQKLDSQRGSVLAAEVRNNGNKLAQWTYQALLSGSELKLGFISRVNPKDNKKHMILGTSQYHPFDFSSQINLNYANGFGILKALFDVFMKLPEGNYVLLKDPNKQMLRLYSAPNSKFEDLRKIDSEEAERMA